MRVHERPASSKPRAGSALVRAVSRRRCHLSALIALVGTLLLCYVLAIAVAGHGRMLRIDSIASRSELGTEPDEGQYSNIRREDLERRQLITFTDLEPPPVAKRGDPPLLTSYQRARVVQRADWFSGGIECKETCCVRRVAVSLDQDAESLITTIDGIDLADVILHGHRKQRHHEWVGTDWSPRMLPCLKPGTIVWADSYGSTVQRFFGDVRSNITVPYLIISGDTDLNQPLNQYGREFLESDGKLMKWYGINPKYTNGANHPKFRMMHLGLSRNHPQQPHLLRLQRSRGFQNPFAGREAKKRWTESEALTEATDTTPVLFVKFGINRHSQHRINPLRMACDGRTTEPLDDISCTDNNRTATQAEIYTAASKYLFGLSPPGAGGDCYRTYELLFLGIIPIIEKRPEYDELFEGLPVIQLDGWNHSQADLLRTMRDFVASPKFRHNDFDGWERLFLKYWRRMVLKDTGRDKEVVKDPDGREYYQAYVYSDYTRPRISSF